MKYGGKGSAFTTENFGSICRKSCEGSTFGTVQIGVKNV